MSAAGIITRAFVLAPPQQTRMRMAYTVVPTGVDHTSAAMYARSVAIHPHAYTETKKGFGLTLACLGLAPARVLLSMQRSILSER